MTITASVDLIKVGVVDGSTERGNVQPCGIGLVFPDRGGVTAFLEQVRAAYDAGTSAEKVRIKVGNDPGNIGISVVGEDLLMNVSVRNAPQEIGAFLRKLLSDRGWYAVALAVRDGESLVFIDDGVIYATRFTDGEEYVYAEEASAVRSSFELNAEVLSELS